MESLAIIAVILAIPPVLDIGIRALRAIFPTPASRARELEQLMNEYKRRLEKAWAGYDHEAAHEVMDRWQALFDDIETFQGDLESTGRDRSLFGHLAFWSPDTRSIQARIAELTRLVKHFIKGAFPQQHQQQRCARRPPADSGADTSDNVPLLPRFGSSPGAGRPGPASRSGRPRSRTYRDEGGRRGSAFKPSAEPQVRRPRRWGLGALVPFQWFRVPNLPRAPFRRLGE
ncbi:hypothetical protein C8Q77DRAFT_770552 [Trametes polyzona]|nr:hypothetical protein C8Q77DRAFT_770552 [Trametes polyzona]